MSLYRFWKGRGAAQMVWMALFCGTVVASAREFRVQQMPNGSRFGCATCHVAAGGSGPRNPFGQAVGAIVNPGQPTPYWSATLAALDSDGDGATNGEELGDPDGDGTPTPGALVTNPGNAASKPPENAAPQVSITSPTSGATLMAPATNVVEVTATDADGTIAKVEIFDGERLLGVDSEAPYSLRVDWVLGAYSLTAKATDDKGASTTSAPVTVTVEGPEATRLTRIVRNGGAVQLEWTAGGGPYLVQTKAAMDDPWCAAGDLTAALQASVSSRGELGLYRIADMAVGGAVPFTVVLGGAYERPEAIVTEGTGSGMLRLEGNTLTFDVEYSGLGGPATMAHIHGPAGTDAPAGVMIDLEPFNGDGFGVSGRLTGSVVLTMEQKVAVLSGKTYVNVHTDANQSGEIRGQIAPVAMGATLSGAQEAPEPVVTAGRGSAHFSLAGDQLSFVITYSGLSGPATLAHIHGPAPIGVSTGVMVDLASFHDGTMGVSGRFVGTVTLTPEQWVAVVSGLTYVNVHTDLNRSGEIRGQILPCVTATPLGASMSGDAEVPAVVTTGSGRALMRLEGDILSFDIRYGGLSGPATMAHIHGPADTSTSAGVMIDLAPFHVGALDVAGAFTGSVRLTPDQKAAVLDGLTYVNVHTDANQSGEIRGQILKLGLP